MYNSRKNPRAIFPGKRSLFYYITDRHQLTGISLAACIRRAIAWGVDFIQVREKDLAELALFELTCQAVSLARGTRCRVLVNGRADIAIAASAHGVHLPSAGLQVSDIRPWLPRSFLVGVSIHSTREARNACAQGADYLLAGPVFPTESKLRYGPPLGLDHLQRICTGVPLPVLGLGGIHPESIASVLSAGAAGVAGITLFQKNTDFRALQARLRESRSNRNTSKEKVDSGQ